MKLTPLDIRGKAFKRTMRGYIGADVDAVLEEGAEEFERLFEAA
jgi:DivIVA domain-containing protein